MPGVDYATLTIGDVTMSGVDEFGVEWTLTGLDGWWDGWVGQVGSAPRQGAHGSWPAPVWAGPRVVQVEGALRARSWDDASLAWDRLVASIPFSALSPMAVAIRGVPAQMAQVRQAGRPAASRFESGIDFSLSFEAPDPRRYSVDEQVVSTGLPITTGGRSLPISLPLSIGATVASGRLQVLNAGNEAAPVVLEVMGPVSAGATVTNLSTGQRLAVPEAVPSGQTLVIDSVSHTARIDGSSRTVTGTWFDLAPGVNEVAFGAPSYDPAAQLTIRYRHAWR